MDKVYITFKIPNKGIEYLKKEFDVHVNPQQKPLSREWFLENGGEYDAFITMLHDPVDREVLDVMKKRVKVIANYAVGFNNIDIEYASRCGITVTNTPDVLTNATAEIAFALMLSVMRRIVEGDRYVREGAFDMWKPELLLGEETAGKTVGILGMGRIGRSFARKCRCFGMNMIYHNRHPLPKEEEVALGVRYAEFSQLIEQSDVISIHLPLTPETRHLFTWETFQKMKRGAFIINTGRGPVICEEDLVKALKKGLIKGAGLDVYEYEPEVHKGLLELPNTVLLPHIGSGSVKARETMSLMVGEAVADVLHGKTPRHKVAGP
ncbi:D-glycerate dehydrogenase [Candidatus Mcinerneyibacteriota bacterium]|nr:D-glycerate dehydrogenase [Candidatus Mcinerneyibacteriota bacterium]